MLRTAVIGKIFLGFIQYTVKRIAGQAAWLAIDPIELNE